MQLKDVHRDQLPGKRLLLMATLASLTNLTPHGGPDDADWDEDDLAEDDGRSCFF